MHHMEQSDKVLAVDPNDPRSHLALLMACLREEEVAKHVGENMQVACLLVGFAFRWHLDNTYITLALDLPGDPKNYEVAVHLEDVAYIWVKAAWTKIHADTRRDLLKALKKDKRLWVPMSGYKLLIRLKTYEPVHACKKCGEEYVSLVNFGRCGHASYREKLETARRFRDMWTVFTDDDKQRALQRPREYLLEEDVFNQVDDLCAQLECSAVLDAIMGYRYTMPGEAMFRACDVATEGSFACLAPCNEPGDDATVRDILATLAHWSFRGVLEHGARRAAEILLCEEARQEAKNAQAQAAKTRKRAIQKMKKLYLRDVCLREYVAWDTQDFEQDLARCGGDPEVHARLARYVYRTATNRNPTPSTTMYRRLELAYDDPDCSHWMYAQAFDAFLRHVVLEHATEACLWETWEARLREIRAFYAGVEAPTCGGDFWEHMRAKTRFLRDVRRFNNVTGYTLLKTL